MMPGPHAWHRDDFIITHALCHPVWTARVCVPAVPRNSNSSSSARRGEHGSSGCGRAPCVASHRQVCYGCAVA
jgi:hypothetical protein